LATYFGSTAMEVNTNWGNWPEVANGISRKMYGVNQSVTGFAAYDPWDMIKYKWGPYIGQRWVRKGLRAAGISLPKLG